MTLKIYLPPGKMTLEHFTNWFPTVIQVLKEKNVEYAEGRWNYPGDLASKPPGIVMYGTLDSSIPALTLASVCETHGHLCLYIDRLIFVNREALKGEEMAKFVRQWLERCKALA